MFKLGFLGVIGGIIAAIIAITDNSMLAAVVAMGLWLASIEVMVLTKAAGGFTAVILPVLTVNIAGLGALLLWNPIRSEAIVSIRFRVTDDFLIQGALICIVFSAAFTVGAVVAGPRSMRLSKATLRDSLSELGGVLPISDAALVAVGYAGIAVAVYGWQGALLEGRYLQSGGPEWAVTIGILATPISCLCLCLVAARPGRWRNLAVLGLGVWVLILFARSSRSLAAIPAFLIAARALTGRGIGIRSVVLASVATIFLLQLSLVGRVNPSGVGLIPLSELLFTRTNEIASGISLSALLGNILIAGPESAVVANRPIEGPAFWVSINPMPGGFAGWDEYKYSLRFTKSMPYNTLGELGSHGWAALMAVAAASGILLALSTRIAWNLKGAYATVAALLVLGSAGFFSVSILQYNLRSSSRIVWYAFLGVSVIWFGYVNFGRRDRPNAQLTGTSRSDRVMGTI